MRTFAVVMMTALVAGPALAQPPGGRGMRGGFGGGAMLLSNPSVQKELNLSEDQIKKTTEFREKLMADLPRPEPGTQPDPEKMAELRKKMTEAGNKFIKETLTADQAKRFKQIELQAGGLFAAANNEETSKTLKLTDDQKEKIKEIQQQQQKDMRELFSGGGGFGDPETQKKMAALRKEASAKAVDTLTTDQKKTWEEMTGKPFEIQFTPGQGGGFGKGKGKRRPNPDK